MRSPINQPICTRCLLMLVFMLMSLGISAQSQVRWGDPTSAAAFVEVNEWPMNWSNRGDAYPVLSNPNKATVTYSSSNTGVATIDANSGAISPVAPGSTTITASVVDAPSASYTLTYTDDRRELGNLGFGFSSTTASATYGDGTITPLSLIMGQLSGASVTYSSSVQSVATVDNAGSVTIKGAGSTEISASFAGDDYVKPGSASYTLTVNPKEVGLTWGTTSFIYDGSAHAPTATATGLVGNDACTVTVEGAKTDAGSNYIATASVLSNTNYKLPTDNTTTFSIAKAASSVTTAPTANILTYTGSAQALVTAGAASGGTMQYSLDNQTFAETVPTGTNVGSYTVYYKVVGDANHENAEGGQVVATIAKANATVTFASKMASGKMGEAFTAPKVTTSPADLTLAYTSSNTKVATVDGSTGAVTLVAAGETTITASFAGNDNYNAANDSYTLTVAKADAVNSDLSFASATATATYGDETVSSPALANPHQLSLTWSSSNKDVATVNASGVVTIVGAGETVISAAFAGNDAYMANTISYTLTVNKAAASVTFASKTASGKMGEAFTAPKVTTSPADLTLSYASSNTKVATVDGSTGAVTLVAAGETTITASFAGNDNYNAANDSYTLAVAKADPVSSDLSFASETATATFGDATVTSPELTNPHQLPLTWSSSDEGVATVNASGVVTIVGAGETAISAAFAGDEAYIANTISYTLSVKKADATVTFASRTASGKMGEAFTAPKVTTSPVDLTLSYTSSDTKVATVDASTGAVTLVAAGETTITASFAGNDNYNAANDSYTLTVAKADAVSSDLSFASGTATATFGDATVTSPELTNPHQLPLTWSSSNEGVATVNTSGVVTIVGAGETVISAAFAGNDTYGANTISYTLTVNKYQPNVAFAATAITAILGEPFTSPKVTTTPKDLPLIYTSSDETVASVDANSGEVVLLGVGTTKIKAIYTASQNYHSASSYYDLTVEDEESLLDPIEEDKDYLMDEDYFINADGTEVDLSNTIVNDILFTLKNQDSPEGDGYDPDLGCIVFNTVTPASTVNSLVEKGVLPGTDDYASQFTGMTFVVPSGEGHIIVTSQEAKGVYLKVKVGKEKTESVSMQEMGDYSIPYKSSTRTYVYLWNGGSDANGTRGKKSALDVRVRKVSYKSAASDIQQVIGELTDDERWYNLNGLRITRPTKKGVYIHGSRKVVIK